MTEAALSHEAAEFLRHYINTAELLDVLMTMEQNPMQEWTALEVSNAIFSVPQSVELRFEELITRGLASRVAGSTDRVRLTTLPPGQQSAISEIHAAYRRNRAQVVNLTFQNAKDPLLNFADAFKFRKP